MSAKGPEAALPLAGVRVVEVAHWVAVPAAGALLADLGAEVVKIEPPPRGEVYRRSRPRYAGYDCDFPESPAFHMDNRGKRCLALDIARPEVCDAIQGLIARADVFMTNLLPHRRSRYGFDHESLLERHPSLVVAAISGYGLGGDEADRPAFDYTAYWARTGMMDMTRDAGVRPSMLRPAMGDHAAAVNLVCAILCALRLRDVDGCGRYVETSLLQTGLHILGSDVANALVTREPVPHHDRSAAPNPLWNSYRTADDRWLLLVMIEPDRYWPRLCEAIERPDLPDDPRFAEALVRAQHASELVTELERAIAAHPLATWEERFDAAELIWAPVRRVDEAIDDPQARAMDYVRTIEHPAGPIETVGPPFRIDGLRLGAERAASPVNEDLAELLVEAGVEPGDVEKLL